MRRKLLLLLSMTLNVVFFRGDPDESLSARAWRQRERGWGRMRSRIDRFFGPDHCKGAYDAQRSRERARM